MTLTSGGSQHALGTAEEKQACTVTPQIGTPPIGISKTCVVHPQWLPDLPAGQGDGEELPWGQMCPRGQMSPTAPSVGLGSAEPPVQ